MPLRPVLLAALLTLSATLGAEADDALRWRLEPDDFVRYRIEVLERTDTRLEGKDRKGAIDDVAGFHGYELAAGGQWVNRPVTHPELLYVPFVFALPDHPGRRGRRTFEKTLAGNRRLQPFTARGQLRVTAGPGETKDGTIELAGRVDLKVQKGGAPAYTRLEKGRLAWTARFDLECGLMTTITYDVRWSIGSGARAAPRSVHAVDPSARKFEARIRLDLEKVLAYRYRGFESDVDRAITEGLATLEHRQRKNGSWGSLGRTALVLLALVDGGRPADHPSVVRGFDWLLRQTPWVGTLRRRAVYGIGVALMGIERRRTPPEEVDRRRRGLATEFLPRRLTGRERAWMSRCVGFLLEVVRIQDRRVSRRGPVTGTPIDERWRWGYGREGNETYWDNSNTQYAVLGLESAARCKVPVPRRAWLGIANHFLAVQGGDGRERQDLVMERGGPRASRGPAGARAGTRSAAPVRTRSRGWSYKEMPRTAAHDPVQERAYGSMTTAGIGSLAIAYARIAQGPDAPLRSKLLERIDQAILDGFASLDDMFSVWKHPNYEGWYTYYLYGLERAGMLASVRRFGEHDWYWEGAVQLLSRQSTYGRGMYRCWDYDYFVECSTAWAILFLKRGTPPVITPR